MKTAEKTQLIRLADVFLIGPSMVYGGYYLSTRPMKRDKVLGLFLLGSGIATVIYNGRNYYLNEARA